MTQIAEVPIASACGDTNEIRLMNLQDDIKEVIARLKSFKGGFNLKGYDNEHIVDATQRPLHQDFGRLHQLR